MTELTRHHSEPLRTVDDVASIVARAAWADSSPSRPDRIGVEVEAFPIVATHGRPGRRLLLEGVDGTLDLLDAAARPGSPLGRRIERTGSSRYPLRGGGLISFEPGGQIEHSTRPHDTVRSLAAEMATGAAALGDALRPADALLVPLGVDPWHRGVDVPQQLRNRRYPAMDAFFSRRGAAGVEMMRNTCAFQVNLDAGVGRLRAERWRSANAISPLLTALFSTSPRSWSHNRRATVWQRLDPTRTGFPRITSDPIEDVTRNVLRADVLLLPHSGGVVAGRPGWTFADWLRDGHPAAGRPTAADLERHLTTIFTEVRPRGGVLELRSVDALPVQWQLVPVVLAAGALYDDEARREILDSFTADDPETSWRKAARHGLDSAEILYQTRRFVRIALDGAGRLGAMLDRQTLDVAGRFIETYPVRGRTPADEVRKDDHRATLAWAAEGDIEPSPTQRRGAA